MMAANMLAERLIAIYDFLLKTYLVIINYKAKKGHMQSFKCACFALEFMLSYKK